MSYNIIRFDNSHIAMLPHDDEPFDIIGQLVPAYDGAKWTVSECLFDSIRQKTYPKETFDPVEYIDNPEEAAFLAMCGDERIGSIRVCRRWNGNAFVDDLKVDRAHRGNGVGRMLLNAAVQWSIEQQLNGFSLETQDDNLLACRFYLKYGFELGGIDTKSYTHPLYKGETALYFYLADEVYRAAAHSV